jgi:hypothetical protein
MKERDVEKEVMAEKLHDAFNEMLDKDRKSTRIQTLKDLKLKVESRKVSTAGSNPYSQETLINYEIARIVDMINKMIKENEG